MLGRRRFLGLSLASTAALLLSERPAAASIARALSLQALVRASDRALFGTALAAESRWEVAGGRRRIVTHTRVRVDERIAGPDDGSELWVRTLGGKVGDVGQIVHGEALLLVGEPALLFLAPSADGALSVAGMAQGHYPVRTAEDGERRLRPSPRLGELIGEGAARELSGRRLGEASALVRKAWDAR